MWIILFNALDDYGIKDLNSAVAPPNLAEIESTKRKVADEALHGALRIAGLVSDYTRQSCDNVNQFYAGWRSDI
jgi:hypothetical protein